MCLKESFSPDCWKALSVVPLSKNVGERPNAKNYHPFSHLFVVSKVFEKLVSNMIVDPLEKCNLFSDFQYGFRSSKSTADFLAVVSDRIARAFSTSGATPAVARLLTEFAMLVFFTNWILMEFQIRYLAFFLLFSLIYGFGWLGMGNLYKNIQLMLEFHKGPFLVLHFSYYTLMNFLMMSEILLYMQLILLSKCDQAFDLQEQLKLVSELKSQHWTGVGSGLLI